MTEDEIKYFLNTYEFKYLSYNDNEIYRYSIQAADKSTYIKLCKTIPGDSFNGEIQLQNISTISPLRVDILKLLNHSHGYWISRIDFAFDYLIPYKHSASIKRHGNQKKKAIGNDYYFTGSTKNKKKPTVHSHYNRNCKNKDATKFEYANRFEAKTFYTRKDGMKFDNIRHDLIVNKLQKEIFVANISHVPDLTEREKDLIMKSKKEGHENCLQVEMEQKEYTKLRKKIKPCREVLEEIYLENYHLVYNFLLHEEENT